MPTHFTRRLSGAGARGLAGRLVALLGACAATLLPPRAAGAQACPPRALPHAVEDTPRSFVGSVVVAGGILNSPTWALRIMPEEASIHYGLLTRPPGRDGPPGHIYLEVPSACRANAGDTVRVTYRPAVRPGDLPLVLAVEPARRPARVDASGLDGWGKLRAAHRAVLGGRLDDALYYYRAAQSAGSRFAGLDVLIDAVERRERMGAIAPADTHRVGAIYVTGIRRIDRAGRPRLENDLTPERVDEWRQYLAVMRLLVESFSGGAWTLAIDELQAIATVHEGDSLKPANPDHLGLGAFFFERAGARTEGDYDTYVTFSSTTSPSMGLARRYPLIEGVLYGPHRGMAAVGTSSLVLLMHEFFHTIEWSARIAPTHGYRPENRGRFAGWPGGSELDYYRWHFRETLPGVGWRRLNHRTRYILTTASREAFARIRSVYDTIPLPSRQEAHRLAVEAGRLEPARPDSAAALYERALALSPYEPDALTGLIPIRSRQGRGAEAEALQRRLDEARSVSDWVDLDD